LSKVNAVRKKALEYVRKQDWQSATKEYKRLVDLDQSNPNVFNELGDIYLKTGNKSEAYDAFTRAIDSYTRVSLHNNAVAVCKKVLRLIPARYEVLIKLGLIRKKQGLDKEAESYYFSYFDKVLVDDQIGPQEVKKTCDEIVDEMTDSTPVLERVYECMTKFNLKNEAGGVLKKLHARYQAEGKQEELERINRLMDEVSVSPPETVPVQSTPEPEGVVITEDNIWSASHSEGERIAMEPTSPQAEASSIGASDTNSVYGYGDLEFGPKEQDGATSAAAAEPADTATQTIPPSTADAGVPETDGTPETETGTADQPADPGQTPAPTTGTDDAQSQSPGTQESPPIQSTDDKPSPGIAGSPNDVHVSAIMDELDAGGEGELSEDDYRSHYDLGMAYLEMDLLPEAIREYQVASRSPKYQASALEMIGLCFLKQNQAHLAIKQLTKGLQVIGPNDSEALGIKYNLGLAYEMAGDFENAKSAFEDVYVEDVTFREVSEKIAKYT
jgi:hypothetical protein